MKLRGFYYSVVSLFLITVGAFSGFTVFAVETVDIKTVNEDLNSKIKEYTERLKGEGEQSLVFEKGEVFVPEGVSGETDKTLERVAAYDVGSTGVKFKVADVDPATNSIVATIYTTTKNTEALGFDINESNYMDRVAIMAGLKALVEEYFPHYKEVKHVAVATAGFRKAGDKGVELAGKIMDMTGIDFKIINQDDEGLLAYYGVMAKVKDFNLANDVVWDIGGGSSQVVLSQNVGGKNELKFYGVEVGGNRFNEFVRRLVKLYYEKDIKSEVSANPLSADEVSDAIYIAEFMLTVPHGVKEFDIKPFSKADISAIKEKVAAGGKVYVIGAVHNFVAKLYADRVAGGGKRDFYTREDIKKAIDLATGKTDKEIFDGIKGGKGELKFVKADITSLILVYSMMNVLGINKVYPIDASNTDGLIIKTVLDEKETGAGSEDIDKDIL